jgi:hypothetical protein
MAPVLKRLTISVQGSTSSSGMGLRSGLKSSRPRRVASFAALVVDHLGELLVAGAFFSLGGFLQLGDDQGLSRWCSPRRRHWYRPPTSRSRFSGTCTGGIGPVVAHVDFLGQLVQSAPEMRGGVPVK